MRYKDLYLKMPDRDGIDRNVKQVTKTAAKKAFNKGETIWLHPCNMRLNNPWGIRPCPIDKEQAFYVDESRAFEAVVNNFKYYNCDNERGKYPIYFIKVDKIEYKLPA